MAVSPDGSFVVYSANERGGQYDLYKVASAGGTPVRLAPDAPQGWRVSIDPVVSPNGQWVSVLTSGGVIHVLATNATNTALDPQYAVAMPVAAYNFTFSGDSSAFGFRADIAVDGKYDVYRLPSFFGANQVPALVQSAGGGSVTEFTWR